MITVTFQCRTISNWQKDEKKKKEQTGDPPSPGTQMNLLRELSHCYFTGAFFH